MHTRLAQTRCFLLDMDGTTFLGERLLPGAQRLVQVLAEQGRRHLFLTNNSSQRARHYAEKLTRLGLPSSTGQILTSGEAAALYLQTWRPGARLYVVGTPSLEEEFRAHGFEVGGENPTACVLGFDTTLTYNKLWRLCDLVRAGLPYIATHSDANCPVEEGFMPDAGAMIAFVQTATGRPPDAVLGKPNPGLARSAALKMGVAVEELAVVGDRLYTDIALGKAAGIPSILVLCGETRRSDLAGSPFHPDFIFENLDELAGFVEGG